MLSASKPLRRNFWTDAKTDAHSSMVGRKDKISMKLIIKITLFVAAEDRLLQHSFSIVEIVQALSLIHI